MGNAVLVLLAASSLGVICQSSASGEEPLPACSISFIVLKGDNGKPIRNASVVMHQVNEKHKQERGGLQLKTDSDGHASFDGVPYGVLRVQVLAPGFQTYGEDFDVAKPQLEITVKLKRPQGQYSIYDDHVKPGDKPPDAPATPPASEEKPKP